MSDKELHRFQLRGIRDDRYRPRFFCPECDTPLRVQEKVKCPLCGEKLTLKVITE